MKKLLVSLLVLLTILTIGAEARAQAAKSGSGPDMMAVFRPPTDKEIDTITEQLQLTEEQHAKMRSINSKYKAEIQTLMTKYQNGKQALMRSFEGTPNPDRVQDDIRNLNQIHTAIVDKEAELWGAISDTLTDDQAVQFWKLFGRNRLRAGSGGGAARGARQAPRVE